MFSDLLYDFNWMGFAIAWVGLAFFPTFFLVFFDMSFISKLGILFVLTIIVFFAVKSGGAKRGFLSK